MKHVYLFVVTAIFVMLMSDNAYGSPVQLEYQGDYLGLEPPGDTAVQFAPQLISNEFRDRGISFTPDLKEIYFFRKHTDRKWVLVQLKSTQDKWYESVIMPRIGRPTLSPNGSVMHMGRKYMMRSDTGWSDVKSLGPAFEQFRIMRLTATDDGTYIFDEVGPKSGDGVLRYSRLVNGVREEPKVFGKQVNNGKFNAHPFVAPDGSFFIFDGVRENGFGESDLYISFRQADGSWGEAMNMGEKVNSSSNETGATVSPDGKYLFFHSSRVPGHGGIFWINTQIIQELEKQQYAH
jgi:hypothetical protein